MVIALIALIVVGPEQLPSVMRKVGETIAQLRSMSSSLRTEFMSGLQEADITRWGDGSADSPIVPRGFSADTAQPDTAQPDTTQPDTTQPDTAQPDTAQPDTARSEPSRAEAGEAPDDEPGEPAT